MDWRFDFAGTKRRLAALGLTSNMFVNKHSDFLALGFLTGVDIIVDVPDIMFARMRAPLV